MKASAILEKQEIRKRTAIVAPVTVELQAKQIPAKLRGTTKRNLPGRIAAAFRFPALKDIQLPIAIAFLALIGAVVTFLIIGTGAPQKLPSHNVPILPEDHTVESLIQEYVYGTGMGGGADMSLPMQSSVHTSLPPSIADGASTNLVSRFEPISYTVRRGDTISEIAAEFGVRLDTIISINAITDVRAVQAGSVLRIPAYEGESAIDGVVYTVRRGDTLGEIAGRHNVDLLPILDANFIESDVIQPGQVLFIPDAIMNSTELKRALGTLFIRPVEGRLTSRFGSRIDPFENTPGVHYGVDWANVTGTPVRASNNGTVSVVRSLDWLYGNYIVIDHRDGFQTLYAHLSSILVREGQRVQQGDTIGKVGSTGRSTGPHLHFTIYKNYDPVDPLLYVH